MIPSRAVPAVATFAAVIAALAPRTAAAQPVAPATAPDPAPATIAPAAAPPDRLIQGVLGGALTYGGEKLASVPLSDGTTRSVHTGGLLDGWLGVQVHPADAPWSVIATVGYHMDCVCASNGDIMFTRVPYELIGMVELAPHWRAGLGYRHTTQVRLRSSGAAPGAAQDFDDANGAIVQGEWRVNPHFGVVLRLVSEKYGYTQTYVDATDHLVIERRSRDGSHGGVGVNWYF